MSRCLILVKMNFIQVELGLGLLIAKTDLPCLFKRLRGPAPRHPEGLEYWPRPALPPKGRGPRLGGPEAGPCPGHPTVQCIRHGSTRVGKTRAKKRPYLSCINYLCRFHHPTYHDAFLFSTSLFSFTIIPKLRIPSTIKTQNNLVSFCLWADWAITWNKKVNFGFKKMYFFYVLLE